MIESYALMNAPFPQGCQLLRDESAPLLFAVWCPVANDATDLDIIGAGNTAEDAVEEARRTVEGWS